MTLVHGEEKRVMVRAMFDSVAPRYDLLNRLISCGLDMSWRRRTVTALDFPEARTCSTSLVAPETSAAC